MSNVTQEESSMERQKSMQHQEDDVGVRTFFADVIKDVSVPKLLLGALMGSAAGVALSFVSQTLVDPVKQISMPFDSSKIDYLRQQAPELLHAISDFYDFRRFVERDSDLAVYDKQTEIIVDSAIILVAAYNRLHALRDQIGFSEQLLQQYAQLLKTARDHLRIANNAMNVIPQLLTNRDIIQVKSAYNNLHTLFEDRLYNMTLIAQGVR